ncbi:MAG: hypothetical protein ACR2NL_07280 [Acidimicrobiia bacterium]
MTASISACTNEADRTESSSADSAPCRAPTSDELGATDTTELVLVGVSRAQANDLRCGPPNDQVRICRALFLLATLDPALHLDQEPLRQRVGDALLWALRDAEAVASPPLVDALGILQAATRTLTTSTDEPTLSDALALRVQPEVTHTIDDYWSTQCS